MRIVFDENEFDLHVKSGIETHFHNSGFPKRLVLTQRQKNNNSEMAY